MSPELLARLHGMVDATLGEAVCLVPFADDTTYLVGGQDLERPIVELRAKVDVVPDSVRVLGKIANTGHNAELRTATHTVTFTTSGVPYAVTDGDRIVLLERDCRELRVNVALPFGTDRTIAKLESLREEQKL